MGWFSKKPGHEKQVAAVQRMTVNMFEKIMVRFDVSSVDTSKAAINRQPNAAISSGRRDR